MKKSIEYKKIGGIVGVLVIAAIALGCIGDSGVQKDTYKVSAPNWKVGDYFIYADDSWVDPQSTGDDAAAGYAEIWSVTDSKRINGVNCWEVQVITSQGYNYTAYMSKDEFKLIRLYISHYNSSYIEMKDYGKIGLSFIVKKNVVKSSSALSSDYWWKMDMVRYNYTLNSVAQNEEYYYDYIDMSIKSYEIQYSAVVSKYTFEWGIFDVLSMYFNSNWMLYSSDFGFYEGISPITEYGNNLFLLEKGNNKKILNDSNSDHIPDALAQANVDILKISAGTSIASGIDWTPGDGGIAYMNIQNDAGIAKIVNTTIYSYRTIQQVGYNVPNLNGNVSVYIYKYKERIYDPNTNMPSWTLVAKAEDISGTWWTIQGQYGAMNITNVALESTFSAESGISWVEPFGGALTCYRVVFVVDGDFKGDIAKQFTTTTASNGTASGEINNRLCFWGF